MAGAALSNQISSSPKRDNHGAEWPMRAMMGAAALIASAVGAQAQTDGYQGAAGSQASANSCCAPVELYTAPAGSAPATFAEVGAAYRAAIMIFATEPERFL